MKTCLLCSHEEPGRTRPSPKVNYLCSDCIQILVKTPPDKLTEMYRAAIRERQYQKAYALHSFIPRPHRQKLPWRNIRGFNAQSVKALNVT